MCLLAMVASLPAQDPDADGPTLTIPAFCGYAHPDPEAVERDLETGAVREFRGKLVFYVEVMDPGWLTLRLTRQAGPWPSVTLACYNHPDDSQGSLRLTGRPLDHETDVDKGRVRMPRPGMLRLELSADDGSPLRGLEALHLGGPAAAGAKTLTVERRNASSVHLWYDVPTSHRDDVEWFCCELTPKTDPLWTYYMATGFARGYFGMQVNSPTERRVIFSVWDSGGEAKDRAEVAAEDRVQLVEKGDGVVASGFGNEGTGGHSHLVHDWRLGDTLRFVFRVEPTAATTTYTGWFQHLRDGELLDGEVLDRGWRLVASFRAPKDGGRLRGLYSFSENFHGANGDRLRACEYGGVWARTTDGEWLALRSARFSHDDHGDQHRTDRRGSVRDGRFVLEHGDFGVRGTRRGTRLALPDEPGAPPAALPASWPR